MSSKALADACCRVCRNGASCLARPRRSRTPLPDATTMASTQLVRQGGTQLASPSLHWRQTSISNHQLLESSVLELLRAELQSQEGSRAPSTDYLLAHLPPLLNAAVTNLAESNVKTSTADVIDALSQAQCALLSELQQAGLTLSLAETRALCKAVHHGMRAVAVTSVASHQRDPLSETEATVERGDAPTHQASSEHWAGDPDAWWRNARHELRTPLQAILGWVSLLKSGQLPEQGRARALEAIERNAKLQSHLISTVLKAP